MSFTAICPNCKFYTPAEEGQKFLSQKRGQYLVVFNLIQCFQRSLACVLVSHPSARNIESTHQCNADVSLATAPGSQINCTQSSLQLNPLFQVKLTALETGEAQNLSGPEIVGGSIFANQIPGGSLCCQVVGLLVPQWSSAACLLQYLKFNEVRSAASISF